MASLMIASLTCAVVFFGHVQVSTAKRYLTNLTSHSNFTQKSEVTNSEVKLWQIKVRSGQLVDKISFVYSDGHVENVGNDGGVEGPVLELDDNDYLIKIEARAGDSLDYVKFITKNGKSKEYGNRYGGVRYELSAQPGNQIWSVERDSKWCGKITSLKERPALAGICGKCYAPEACTSFDREETCLGSCVWDEMTCKAPFDTYDMHQHWRNPGNEGDCQWRCNTEYAGRCTGYTFDSSTLICKLVDQATTATSFQDGTPCVLMANARTTCNGCVPNSDSLHCPGGMCMGNVCQAVSGEESCVDASGKYTSSDIDGIHVILQSGCSVVGESETKGKRTLKQGSVDGTIVSGIYETSGEFVWNHITWKDGVKWTKFGDVTKTTTTVTTTTITSTVTRTSTTTRNCKDLDHDGITDSGGDNCEYYKTDIDGCGEYDDEDFQAKKLCCACGGGADV